MDAQRVEYWHDDDGGLYYGIRRDACGHISGVAAAGYNDLDTLPERIDLSDLRAEHVADMALTGPFSHEEVMQRAALALQVHHLACVLDETMSDDTRQMIQHVMANLNGLSSAIAERRIPAVGWTVEGQPTYR